MATIVEPTGVSATNETTIPKMAHNTDSIAEQSVTEKKVLNIRIAASAGNIVNAEIKREPTKFIESTIITAMTTAIMRLYAFAFVPTARAKFSSNVTSKIL